MTLLQNAYDDGKFDKDEYLWRKSDFYDDVFQYEKPREKNHLKDVVKYLKEAGEIKKKRLEGSKLSDNEKQYAQECLRKSYINIGYISVFVENFTESLSYYNLALDLSIAISGGSNTVMAGYVRLEMVNVYKKLSLFKKAQSACEDVIKIFENILSPWHSYRAKAYQVYGELFYDMKDYDQAKYYIEIALAILSKVFGTMNQYAGDCYNVLAYVHRNIQNYQESYDYCIKACDIFEDYYGYSHPKMEDILKCLFESSLMLDNCNQSITFEFFKQQYIEMRRMENEGIAC